MSVLHLSAPGRWSETRPGGEAARGRPALFLDRDGAVVEEVHFLHRPQDLRLVPGAADTVAAARAAGYAVVLVTNQSGIGRGLYGWPDFAAVQDALHTALAAARPEARVDMVLACAEHPEGVAPYRIADSSWRKPGAGMLEAAVAALDLGRAGSLIVGDRATDLAAGKAAGIARGVLVATGYGSDATQRRDAEALAEPGFAVDLLPSLAEVRRLL